MQFYCHIFGIDLNIELLNSNKQGTFIIQKETL